MKEIKEISRKKILLDTNVLINCGREEYGLQFRKILQTLRKNKNYLGISLISGFEIIKKFRNKKVVGFYLKLLNKIPQVQPDLKTMNIAGMLANELNQNGNIKKDNDYIIGATVIRNHGSMLLTSDRKDFSYPFWDVIARECVLWKDNEFCRIENVFILKFNNKKWMEKYKDDFKDLATKEQKKKKI